MGKVGRLRVVKGGGNGGLRVGMFKGGKAKGIGKG